MDWYRPRVQVDGARRAPKVTRHVGDRPRRCPRQYNTSVDNTTHLLYNDVVAVPTIQTLPPAHRSMKTTRSCDYPVRLTVDNDTIVVTFLDFPEAHTFGATLDEAVAHSIEALATLVGAYIRARRPIPRPSRARRTVALHVLT